DPEAGRARTRARREAATAPARRAGRRLEPRGGRRTRRVRAPDPRRARAHDPPRRASHDPRHARVRPRERPQLRPEDRRRHTGRGAGRPRRHRGLPGKRGGRGVKTLLELDRVEARYGPVQALHDVSLTVGEGEIVAVLGANGAGKTTTLRAISGTVA